MKAVDNSSGTRWKVVRSFPRFGIAVAFSLQPAQAGALGLIHGRMVDIGLGGFAGVCSTEVNLRQRLAAEFYLPGSLEPLQVKVIVRYHNGSRYGFEFLDISPEQREQIRQACHGLIIL